MFPHRNDKAEVAAELALKFAELGPVLVFCSQRNYVAQVAEALLLRLTLARSSGEPIPLPLLGDKASKSMEAAKTWLGPDHLLSQTLSSGIGIHYGPLPAQVKEAIESDFRDRHIRILVATNTLAQGVNLPIRTVLIHSSRRYDSTTRLTEALPSADYWNIVGRAGRATEETEGTVVHITITPADRSDYRRYLRERLKPPPMKSALYRLLTDLVASRTTAAALYQRLDPEILALLAEEAPGLSDSTGAPDILKDTLTLEQGKRYHVSVDPLRSLIRERARAMGESVPQQLRSLFSATGLSPSSCQLIQGHVSTHEVRLRDWLADPSAEGTDRISRPRPERNFGVAGNADPISPPGRSVGNACGVARGLDRA